ncbi:MAG: methylglutaconyl-CoA hydratase [Hyphomonadaceae bacterium]|nr:MAG: methylglutaconyl-CoA hydratase [Hyphomonadaceae bacterium]KAF0182979.1 MAG: methylglutaconyl-CoA hydratase [Hyphomonadaceae bacterium]
MTIDEGAILELTAEGTAFVTLNRPAKKNAFDEIMIGALSNIFETLRVSDNVRLVVIRGAGDVFCAGGDLEWMKRQARHDFEDNEADSYELALMLNRLYHLPQITLALVEGAAFGGGTGLIAACDYAIATKDTKFCFSEVRMGLTPANISPYVIEAIGPRYARALFTTARQFDGEYAKQIGLIHEVVADKNEMAISEEAIARLAFSAAPGAVADTKHLINAVKNRQIDQHLMHETAKKMAHRRASDEGREGLNAFLEKRAPDWSK